jgi:hypothetical protein
MLHLLAQIPPEAMPPAIAVPGAPVAQAPELFDVPLGAALLLILILGLIRYGLKTPGPQRKAGVWGVLIGWLSYAIVVGLPDSDSAPNGVPIVGGWVAAPTRKLINPPIPRPPWDWFNDGVVTTIQWSAYIIPVALLVYLYLTRLWGVRMPWQKNPARPGQNPNAGRSRGKGGPAAGVPMYDPSVMTGAPMYDGRRAM